MVTTGDEVWVRWQGREYMAEVVAVHGAGVVASFRPKSSCVWRTRYFAEGRWRPLW